MATFEAQVEALTGISISGSSSPTQTELSSFLVDGVIDVVNRVIMTRPAELSKFTKTTNATDSVAKTGKILSVVREHDSTTILRKCAEIDPGDRYDATDTDSLNYRSKTNPGYYELSGLILCVPEASSGNNDIIVTQVHYDTGLINTDNYQAGAIENFPKDYEYLVAIYAAIQSLRATMGNNVILLTSVPPDVPSLATVSFSESNSLSISATAPTAISLATVSYTDAVNADASATAVGAITVATVAKADISGDVPAYTKPGHPAQVAFADYWTVGDFGDSDPGELTVTAVLPSTPTITAASVTITGTAPTYTKPSLALKVAPTISDLSITAVPPDTPSAPSVAGVAIASVAKGSLATSAPAYTKPGHPTQVAFTDYTSGLSETDPGVLTVTSVTPVPPTAPSFSTPTIGAVTVGSTTLTNLGVAPSYTSPTATISGTAWATAYPDEYTALNIALAAITTEVGLAKAEAAEIVTQTDNSSDFATALTAMNGELDKVDDIIVEASAEFDKSSALLLKGEVDSESAVNDAAAKIVIELDDTRAICDKVGTSADSAITALGNMATEIALANAEVDGVTTTLAQALALTDSGSTDIKTALTGMQTAVAKFRADGSDPALFGDESTYTTGSSAMTNVKTHLDRAISYVNGDFPEADSDLVQYLKDINDQVTDEDTELAASFMQAAQTTMNAMQADLQIAQTYITEWNAMVQTLVSEINAFSSEASSRFGWINAKAVAWQGKLSAAQGYMGTAGDYANQASGFNSTAQTYASEVQARIGLANGYVAEINVRLAQAGVKRQESQSRLTAGNAYIQEAQAYIAQANGYAQEVSARGGFTAAKSQAVQGFIQTAQGYANEVQALLSQTPSKVSEYQAKVQDALNEYNKENASYQAKLQESIQQAQINAQKAQQQAQLDATDSQQEASLKLQKENQEYASKLQKYQAEVSKYQAEVNTQIQEYGQKLSQYQLELNTAYTAWAKTESDNIQVFQSDIQNELNEFNKESAAYQADIQLVLAKFNADVQDAQKEGDLTFQADVQNEQLTLQRYSQELQQYQAEVNTEVQEYQQNLAGDIQVWQAERSTDLQKYSADVQSELNEYNKENAEYQAKLQKDIQDAQLEDAEESKKLQKYQSEIGAYSAQVNKDVQEYGQKFSRYQLELNTVYQAWAKTESDNLQVFQLDIQNELNEFNKENVRYQANIQAELAKHNTDLQKALTQAQLDAADAQQEATQTTNIDQFNKAQDQALDLANRAKQIEDDISNNNSKVAQFQAEAQHYATQVNEDVQAYTSQLQSDVQTMQAIIANNQALLTKYQAETAEYQAEIAAETQEQSTKMQQYQLLYNQLKTEYDQTFMIAAPQQQAAQEAA